jgi:hypothetical protein
VLLVRLRRVLRLGGLLRRAPAHQEDADRQERRGEDVKPDAAAGAGLDVDVLPRVVPECAVELDDGVERGGRGDRGEADAAELRGPLEAGLDAGGGPADEDDEDQGGREAGQADAGGVDPEAAHFVGVAAAERDLGDQGADGEE